MKQVIITGGSSGLGLALVRVFLEKKWAVVAVSRRGVSETGARNLTADLSTDAGVNRFLDETRDIIKLDLLINNAGISPAKRILNMTEAEYDSTVNLNFRAAQLLTMGFQERLNGGMVINILSRVGFEGRIGLTGYSVSKGLLAGFTSGMARELSPAIRFLGVNPGFMITPMVNDKAIEAERGESVLNTVQGPEASARTIAALAENPGYLGHFIDLDSRIYRSWKPLS